MENIGVNDFLWSYEAFRLQLGNHECSVFAEYDNVIQVGTV